MNFPRPDVFKNDKLELKFSNIWIIPYLFSDFLEWINNHEKSISVHPLCKKSVRTGLYNFRTLISVHVRLLWRTEYLDFILLPRKITYIWIFAPKTRHVLIRFAHMKKPCTLLHCIYKMFLWLEFWGPNVDVCWYLIQDFLFKRYVHWSIWKHFDTSCY